MDKPVKVAFASGSEDLIPSLIECMKELEPDLPLYVVSEFPPAEGRWIPYSVVRSFADNYARVRATLAGRRIRFSAVLLQPRMPYWRMRLIGLLLSPRGFIAFNENLHNFMLRPRCAWTIVRHCWWRTKNFARWHCRPGGEVYTLLWRLGHPAAFRRPILAIAARLAGLAARLAKAVEPPACDPRPRTARPAGISVVVPSRDGRALLERLLPGLGRELEGFASEIIVVDNGSSDGTGEWLARCWPAVRQVSSAGPLSFACAANAGIRAARFSRVCLLNNDMVLRAGFFGPLLEAFERNPDLFCATAQIFFPEGARRQETGKAVMPAARNPLDFPVRCDTPIGGEDGSWVLYGSGGCSVYDAAKLEALGGLGEVYQPAYVEDLDLGYRGWLRGWPTVFVASSQVVHEHRATTSRYYTESELERVLEVNYLRFLSRAVASPAVFSRLWSGAVDRLNRRAGLQEPIETAVQALAVAWRAPQWLEPPPRHRADEEQFLALTSGSVAVFPGRPATGRPRVLIVSPYLPFPLSHGGAVRMFNLMRRAAAGFDQVLVAFCDELATPPREVLDICAEVVLVCRVGSHQRPSTPRPDVVEEFSSQAFAAALRQAVGKWKPAIAQLEFTQMAQYARDCAPAATILVEHDITLDLYRQLLAQGEDWELRRQWERWERFERAAWRGVNVVVTMSDKDRQTVTGGRAMTLPNGVDLERFQPSEEAPEPGRILFIGSFAHLPNLLAVDFFLREVWPRLAGAAAKLHIIAGSRHRYFLDHYQDRVQVNIGLAGVEVEDFVADVRPAYRRAEVVVAPLLASAGTNIKIMEAMAMGKAIVSTPAGINGLDLSPGRDVLVTATAEEMAQAVLSVLADPALRRRVESAARLTVERSFDWDVIAGRQARLYEELIRPG